MIEIFKTNIEQPDQALAVLRRIKETYGAYAANFDLQDCDHILRVESIHGDVDRRALIKLVNGMGFHAEVLSDDVPTNEQLLY